MSTPYRDVVPVGATSVRPRWDDLPPAVRSLVAEREGAAIAQVREHATGFTPGLAASLVLDDGRQVFVKAADDVGRGLFADMYRAEAEVVRGLPADVPVPRVRWSGDVDGWFVVALDHVAGRHPRRPWTGDDLDEVLDLLGALPDALGPPAGSTPTFASVVGSFPALWRDVRDPAVDPHRAEALGLAEAAVAAGGLDPVLCHGDVRDDNLLRDDGGRWWVCDWNGLCAGPRGFDALAVLISARGDGLDADAALVRHRRPGDLDEEGLDAPLALFTGYFLERSQQPHLPGSPHLRAHQRWYGEAAWAWLCARRGW